MSEALTVKCRRGWGKVVNPLTGDSINVEEPFETDRDTFEALQERYGGFAVVDTSEPPDTKERLEERTCSGNNGECSRAVADGEDYCWQHQ